MDWLLRVRILVVWLDIGNCLLIDSVVYWLFIIVILGFVRDDNFMVSVVLVLYMIYSFCLFYFVYVLYKYLCVSILYVIVYDYW